MNKINQGRSPALDAIRIFALICVVSVHFFLYSGFYEVDLVGWTLYGATLARTFFMICVPLFLMLSGYLMRNKKPSKAYYSKIIRIIGEYLLAAVFCIGCVAIRDRDNLGFIKAFLIQIFGIFNYEAVAYSWYVNMYIGLFLLIPYLNVLYNGLQGKKAKQGLVFTMLLLTGIPSLFNSAIFSLPWTMRYNDPSNILMLFPNWWGNIYPITFYFIGAYLNEYPLQLSKTKSLLLLATANFIGGTISFVNSIGSTFRYGPWQEHSSFFVIVESVLIFHFFLQLDYSRIGAKMRAFLGLLSDLTFSAYLVSVVFDMFLYRVIKLGGETPIDTPVLFFVFVPIVLVCSLITAYILVFIYKLLVKWITLLVSRFKVTRIKV